ncbi:MAG: hypothetical protein ACI81C_002757 [Alteromonas macleodii]|jgi:hypothetical protein|uniref:replication initiator protein A n=1 Tax=Rheinheimera aquimaris TaxID=412437 RepID=UPI0039E42C10
MKNKVFHCTRLTRALKSDLFSMEYPIFVLDGKVKNSPLKYEHNGISIEVTVKENDEGIGRATIKDKEILMFCLTQMMNKNVFETEKMFMVSFTVYDFLKSVGRGVSGANYQQVFDGLKRLSHTYVLTNHLFNGRRNYNSFSLIDKYEVSETLGHSTITITLGSWLTRQATDSTKKILTLRSNYLTLTRPFERRVYELCRKFCGSKKTFDIGVDNFRKRMTPNTPLREFTRLIKAICDGKKGLLLNYKISLDGKLLKICNTPPANEKEHEKNILKLTDGPQKTVSNIIAFPSAKVVKGCG